MLRGVYQRAFVDRIQAVTGRLDTVIGELEGLREEITQLRFAVADMRSELDAARGQVHELSTSSDSLDGHIEALMASGWDTAALARRLATIEDRLPSG